MSRPMFRLKRALPDRRTPLEDWPRDWLEIIEPRIERGPVEEGDHWFWTGYCLRGVPTITFNAPDKIQKRVVTTNLVVSIFWYIHEDLLNTEMWNYDGYKPWFVKHSCEYKNCMNPQHLIPRARGV